MLHLTLYSRWNHIQCLSLFKQKHLFLTPCVTCEHAPFFSMGSTKSRADDGPRTLIPVYTDPSSEEPAVICMLSLDLLQSGVFHSTLSRSTSGTILPAMRPKPRKSHCKSKRCGRTLLPSTRPGTDRGFISFRSAPWGVATAAYNTCHMQGLRHPDFIPKRDPSGRA